MIIILATFVAYLSPFISPERIWFISLFGTAYPWFLFANILMIAVWMFLKKKYFLFSLTCIIMGWNHLDGFVGIHFGSSKTDDQSINVMTYNAQKFPFIRAGYRIIDEKKSKEVFHFLKTKGSPDILCLQEVGDFHVAPIKAYFGFQHYYKVNYYGTAIFSKYPILEKGKVKFDINVNSCLWVDVDVFGQTIRVYSLHLQSNNVSNVSEKVISEGQLKEEETWSDMRTILRKYKHTSKIRAQQAKTIAAHIASSPYPVIVCGDFNETPQSYAYRLITKNVNDSFKEKGSGFGTTYAGSIPALRIDYILSDKTFKIINNNVLKKSYSDHYPVISVFSLK